MAKMLATFFFIFAFSAHATCKNDSTTIKFDGTAFAQVPFRLTATNLEFFAKTNRFLAITYDPPHDQWCYRSAYKTSLRPNQGCIKRNGKSLVLNGKRLKAFTLRDLQNKQVASLSVKENRLEVLFLLENGKQSGKRIRFTAPLNASQNLEVRAWNCPNENYLSCVGAQLQLLAGSGREDVESKPAIEAEMSKRLAHYEVNCAGLREIYGKEKGPIAGAFSNF